MIEYGQEYPDPLADEIDEADEIHRSHLRMAERLADRHGERLRYAHGLGWLVWDGTRWAKDRDGEPHRAAIEVVKEAIDEVKETGDDDLAKDVRKVETSTALNGIVSIARYLRPIAIGAADLDREPYLFNVANGTLDLRTGELREHDRRDLITHVAGCAYEPDAQSDVFEKFLTEILPPADVRDFVQRFCGYALLGKVTEHVLAIMIGTGCNGKTTLVEAVMKAFGEYAISAEPDLLVERNYAHPTGQADLLGVRLAVTSETDEGRKLATATVKRLTGGDKIRARKMRQDFFEFEPSHTVTMITNHKPRVSGDDPALWRRLRVVPFDVVVPEPDPTLPEKINADLPAVLAWCVAGYLDFMKRGLDAPDAVTARTEKYRLDSDALGRFLNEHTTESAAAYARARELYTRWAKFCKETGETAGTEPTFSDAMHARGFEKKERSVGRVWIGLGLLADDDATTL